MRADEARAILLGMLTREWQAGALLAQRIRVLPVTSRQARSDLEWLRRQPGVDAETCHAAGGIKGWRYRLKGNP